MVSHDRLYAHLRTSCPKCYVNVDQLPASLHATITYQEWPGYFLIFPFFLFLFCLFRSYHRSFFDVYCCVCYLYYIQKLFVVVRHFIICLCLFGRCVCLKTLETKKGKQTTKHAKSVVLVDCLEHKKLKRKTQNVNETGTNKHRHYGTIGP